MLAATILALTPEAPAFDDASSLLGADAALIEGGLDVALDGFRA